MRYSLCAVSVSKFPYYREVILNKGPPQWPHFNLITYLMTLFQVRSRSEVLGLGFHVSLCPRPLLLGFTPTELKAASPEYSIPSLLRGPQNSGPSTIHSKVWVVLSNWPLLPLLVHCYKQISYFFTPFFPGMTLPPGSFLCREGTFASGPQNKSERPHVSESSLNQIQVRPLS